MNTEHKTRLTAPEIANLWTQYMSNTLSICFNQHALQVIEDDDIRSLYQSAQKLANHYVEEIKVFLSKEGFPTPIGFGTEDVNLDAPRLFSDELLLNYLYIMSLHGLTGYAVALPTCSRKDLRVFYSECNYDSIELFNKSIDLMQVKGLYTRPPYINPPDMADYVEKQGFLYGWFGQRRPLNAIEISNITFNMNKINMQKAILVGFAQVGKTEEVREHMLRGKTIYGKHTEVFRSLFREDNLNSPNSWDSMVTSSNVSPFSDKLLMFLIGFLSEAAISFYGAALSTSMRKDLSAHYIRLNAEMMKFVEDSANIMINHGWLEKIPQADDRELLSKNPNQQH